MKRLLLIIAALFVMLPLSARDFGNMSESEMRYRVTSKRSLNVRNTPGLNGSVLFTVGPGDYIYGYAVSADWVKVNGSEWYVSSKYLAQESNPFYQTVVEQDDTYSAERVFRIQKIVRYCLLAACIILFLLFLILAWDFIFEDLFGFSTCGKSYKGLDGKTHFMRQKFYYGAGAYWGVLIIAGLVLAAIVAGVLALMIVGGTVWLLLAIVWLLLYILIIVGWILLVGGVLALFGGGEAVGYGCGGIIIGGVIVNYSDAIQEFGSSALDTGFAFFKNLYVLDFVRDLVVIYWQPALMIILAPILIFLLFVVGTLIISGIFMLVEYIVMMRYNIKNPCPVCQHASEPAVYLSKGRYPLPVNLHPGRYGLFSITHPETKEKMPTMLFNGKDKLSRRCKHCGKVISANMGTEKHIALVGVAESGKTTLVYRLIAEMLRKHPNSIFFTDVTQSDYDMMDSVQSIVKRGYLEHFPPKTVVGQRRAIQLKIQRGMNMFYRLFINDVGGELYSLNAVDSSESQIISQFVRNTESIIFVVDPATIDFSDCDISPEFRAWLGKNQSHTNKIDIFRAFGRLIEFFNSEGMIKGKSLNLHINVVLVKRDLGYLSGIDDMDESSLQGFMVADMGLGRLISDINSYFKENKVHYLSFSAVGKSERECHAGMLSDMIFDQLDIDDIREATADVSEHYAQEVESAPIEPKPTPRPTPKPAPAPAPVPAPAPKPIAASAATGLFDVVLINPGPTKLAVIKIVKELKKCSLAEAKDIVDLAPKVVLSGVSKEEAKRAEVVFEEIEARYEIRPHKR